MSIERRTMIWEGPGGPFEGVAALDAELAGRRPGVLVIPNFRGQKELDNLKAEEIAALGYVGLACDVFGQGRRKLGDVENVSEHMDELQADRTLLRDRLAAALAELKAMPEVDGRKTAAIGFCFGGKCVLDMARSGLDFLGGVSFHGVYDRPSYANVTPIAPKLLVCHGWDDPIDPPETMVALAQELTEGGADWQIVSYGHAGHAFTDIDQNPGPYPGVAYEERADRRSWAVMKDFLAELFG